MEHVSAKDRISNLRCVDEIHLQETGLKVTLLGLVILQRVQEECCRLLDHVLRHKDIHNLGKVYSATLLQYLKK